MESAGVSHFTESIVEEAALAWLGALGYAVLHGPELAAGMPGAERSGPHYRDAVPKILIPHKLGVSGVEWQVEEAPA